MNTALSSFFSFPAAGEQTNEAVSGGRAEIQERFRKIGPEVIEANGRKHPRRDGPPFLRAGLNPQNPTQESLQPRLSGSLALSFGEIMPVSLLRCRKEKIKTKTNSPTGVFFFPPLVQKAHFACCSAKILLQNGRQKSYQKNFSRTSDIPPPPISRPKNIRSWQGMGHHSA